MTNSRGHLNRTFQSVRETFFPRWDKAGRWRVRRVRDLHGAMGKCCPKDKTIRLTHLPAGEAGVALLIHEIVHAVTDQGHGEKWHGRMAKAAATAEAIGRNELAGLLREQFTTEPFPCTAKTIYGEIAGALWDNPEVTFWQAVDFVRRDCGMSRREFLKRFRRARAVFEQEKDAVAECAEARARMAAASQN